MSTQIFSSLFLVLQEALTCYITEMHFWAHTHTSTPLALVSAQGELEKEITVSMLAARIS